MIDLTGYDYVDFGCSSGGSMIYARDHLGGGRGVGIDLDAKKVAATVSRGFDAVVGDLSAAPSFHGNVRFSMCSHFLEHVSDLDTARRCLDTALSISRLPRDVGRLGEFVLVEVEPIGAKVELHHQRPIARAPGRPQRTSHNRIRHLGRSKTH